MPIDPILIAAVLFGVALLLILILYFKIQAFISLLISSIAVGIVAGMPPLEIINTIQKGMAGTLGFVAVVVGLGSIFGAILEQSGGASALAQFMIKKFGENRASWAMVVTGFLVAIPVFFDVGFIILAPLVYALQRKTGKSLLLYALPLLSGLAITHAFIPPTPGPVAVADILEADLGLVILFGVIAGVPAAIISGPLFSKYISEKIHVTAPFDLDTEDVPTNLPSVTHILTIICIPIVLIVIGTLLQSSSGNLSKGIVDTFQMLGHPFSALILANLIAWYTLGIRKGYTKTQLQTLSTKSLGPAGIIILLTGAGGVFKQMLVDTGTGEMLAQYFSDQGINLFVFAFIAAGLVRILQGSATVSMITAAGLTAPLLPESLSDPQKAMLVIVIASGASLMSHVNDSGFWLVSKYLGLTEKQTFKSWTIMTSLLGLIGFLTIFLLQFFY